MPGTFSFTLDGRAVSITTDGATPLLLSLRETKSGHGARQGCGEGQCGACTILLDGRAVTPCTMRTDMVAGRSVETVAGLEGDAIGRALLGAVLDAQAGQCGYCLAGILMRSKALLRETRRPDRAEIVQALEGHLCRCGAHNRILHAVEEAGKLVDGKVGA